jgi:hypothetical protein
LQLKQVGAETAAAAAESLLVAAEAARAQAELIKPKPGRMVQNVRFAVS